MHALHYSPIRLSTALRGALHGHGLRGATVSSAILVLLTISGCGSDLAAPPPITDVARLYWMLTLDHRAVNLSSLAPFDTIHLTATPRSSDGEPLSGLPAPTFTSADLGRVEVDASGLVHALETGRQIAVVATLSVGNITHADTAYINIEAVSNPPTLAALSIHPLPPDSAKVASDRTKKLTARAMMDSAWQGASGLAVHYKSSDPTVASIDHASGSIKPVRPGRVTFTATTTAYGVTRADTLSYTIGAPLSGGFQVTTRMSSAGERIRAFEPDSITIGVGGTVLWLNLTPASVDVIFEDPTHVVAPTDISCLLVKGLCGSGDIEPFAPPPGEQPTLANGAAKARAFPVPGRYPFHSTLLGNTGTVIVVDERAP